MRLVSFFLATLASTGAVQAEVRATFLGGSTFATIATGTPRNLDTVPETLTATGYRSWEGGCTIDKISERLAGKTWRVTLRCSEGAEENVRSTETWTRASDGSILVAANRKTTRFVACPIPDVARR
jgi:hypothetical protein